jgi:phosphoserine phosphatase
VTPPPAFNAVVLDVDSTLCGIEGIDALAKRRGPEVGTAIAALTERAMNGELTLDAIYGERLKIIRPSESDIRELADAYAAALAPGAATVVRQLRERGVRLVLVSGGIRQAILPVARALGFADADLNAVALEFDVTGQYAGYDGPSPLTTQYGKRTVVAHLALPHPILAVGDGSTDIAMREVTDAFAAYVGFIRRENVVAAADHVVASFRELAELTLAGRSIPAEQPKRGGEAAGAS